MATKSYLLNFCDLSMEVVMLRRSCKTIDASPFRGEAVAHPFLPWYWYPNKGLCRRVYRCVLKHHTRLDKGESKGPLCSQQQLFASTTRAKEMHVNEAKPSQAKPHAPLSCLEG